VTRLLQVTARDLVRFPKAQGFVEERQAGSHLTLWHEERKVSATIPVYTGSDVGSGLAVRILKDVGFDVDGYLACR
jgi:predicted RNA binding protein YcfA (HicA-like mRNA interferase family)